MTQSGEGRLGSPGPLLVALTLSSLGILGIYISRIYVMGTGQPGFIIKAEI